MREGWTYKKLGEVADISAGQGAPQGENNYCSDGIPFIKAGNLESLINGMPEQTMQKVSDLVAKSHRLKLYKSGSVLFAKSGMSCMKGWVYTLKNDCYVVSHLAVITPHMQKTEGRYLNYYFQFNKPNTLVKDAAYPSISLKDIENISIPVPSLSEQQSIVAELDKINELISLKKAQLSDLDSLAQSIFYDMFGDPIENEKGWGIKALGTIADFKNGLNFSKEESGNCYKFLGVSDFQDNRIVCSDALNDIHLNDSISNEYLLQTGDIVFVRSNGSKELVGRNILMHITEPTTFSGFCIRCRLSDDDFNSVYLSYLLKAPSMRPVITNSGRGCNISNLNQKILSSLPIIHPPLSLQQEFAKRIELIEKQKVQISSTIKDLETLLASRMQYWFD